MYCRIVGDDAPKHCRFITDETVRIKLGGSFVDLSDIVFFFLLLLLFLVNAIDIYIFCRQYDGLVDRIHDKIASVWVRHYPSCSNIRSHSPTLISQELIHPLPSYAAHTIKTIEQCLAYLLIILTALLNSCVVKFRPYVLCAALRLSCRFC